MTRVLTLTSGCPKHSIKMLSCTSNSKVLPVLLVLILTPNALGICLPTPSEHQKLLTLFDKKC